MRKHCCLLLIICMIMAGGCATARRGSSAAASSTVSRAPAASKGMYAYEHLSEVEKEVYNVMEETLVDHAESARVETLSDDDMKKVFFFVLKDHPEIFWCSSFIRSSTKKGDGTVITEFKPEYAMTKEERYIFKEKIDQVAAAWLAGVPADASDYTKAKVIFDAIVSNVEYDAESDENQNIISVFVNKSSVCSGYSKAFQYLLAKVGIESTLVKGDANEGAHAWNLVKLDGDYYYFDVTWGDPSFSSRKDITDFIDYSYFAVTSEELMRTHRIEDELEMPECTAVRDNYYINEGLVFDSADFNLVGSAIRNASLAGENSVSLKFSDRALYDQAIDYFVKKNHIFDFYSSAKKVFMYNNDELNIMNILFR